MKKISCYAILLLFANCNKASDALPTKIEMELNNASQYQQHLIKKGDHHSNLSTYKIVNTTELKFAVKFDSSAIYTSKEKDNQADVNKLYGFSDNNKHHHQYSARFGWSWLKEALHLYAYVYNDGKRSITDLGTLAIGEEAECSIKILPTKYIFAIGAKLQSIERTSTPDSANGYMLYPYFGGDEAAPHDVSIRIKNL